MKKISPTAGAVRHGCLVYEQQGQNAVGRHESRPGRGPCACVAYPPS